MNIIPMLKKSSALLLAAVSGVLLFPGCAKCAD